MEQVKVFWQKLRDGFWTLIGKIESSVLFERVVTKYESLPTRSQKNIKAVTTLFAGALVIWFMVSPLLATRFEFSKNRSFSELVSSMKLFNSKLESARKEYVSPVGWKPLAAQDMRQLEDSLVMIMAALGIAESQYEIASQGETLLVHAREANIKQLETLMFQIDGLYPRYTVIRNKTTLHPQNKELVQFEIEIAPGEVKDSGLFQDFSDESNKDSPEMTPERDEPMEFSEPQPPSSSDSHINVPPPTARVEDGGSPGGVPGFEPPTFSPIDESESDNGADFVPSNRGRSTDGGGEGSEFIPPMGDGFIPPPPIEHGEGALDSMSEDDDFPPMPPTE